MRLAQLARRLNVKQDTIVEFLHENGTDYKLHPNVKISDDHIELVLGHFDATVLEEWKLEQNEPQTTETSEILDTEDSTEEEIVEPDEEFDTSIEEKNVEAVTEFSNEEPEEQVTEIEETESVESSPSEGDAEEVIRAPKVKLGGIKVVGKIDLPEKKEEPKSVVDESTEDELLKEIEAKVEQKITIKSAIEQQQKPKKKSFENRKKKSRPQRKELSYEEKIKKEERRAENEKKRKFNAEKRRKKKHYDQMMKKRSASSATQNSKANKARKNATSNAETTLREPLEKRTNPIRRFWGWLMGEYDD